MKVILETVIIDILILMFFMPMGMLYLGIASLEFNAIIYKPSKESLDIWQTKLRPFVRGLYMGKQGNPVFMIYPFDIKKDLYDIQRANLLIQVASVALNALVSLFFFAIPILSASSVVSIFFAKHPSEVERIGLTMESFFVFLIVTVLIAKSICFGKSLKTVEI